MCKEKPFYPMDFKDFLMKQIFSKLLNYYNFDNIQHFLLNDFELKFVKKDLKNHVFLQIKMMF